MFLIAPARYTCPAVTFPLYVYETWKNIFYLNDSHLNGEDYIQGNYYRFAVIKVTVRGSVTTALKRLVETSAPVGIRVVYEVVS